MPTPASMAAALSLLAASPRSFTGFRPETTSLSRPMWSTTARRGGPPVGRAVRMAASTSAIETLLDSIHTAASRSSTWPSGLGFRLFLGMAVRLPP